MPATVSATSTSPHRTSRARSYRVRSPTSRAGSAQHGPPPRHEVADRGFQSTVAWPVGPPWTSTSSGGAGRAAPEAGSAVAGREPREPVDGHAVAGRPRNRSRFGQVDRVELPERAPCPHLPAATRRVEHGELRRGTTPDRTHTIPTRTPVETHVPPTRELADGSVTRRHHDEPPEARFVAVDRHRGAVGRPCERPLPGSPRRLGVLALFLEQRVGLRRISPREPHVHPTPLVGHEHERAVGRRETRLNHRDRVATGDDEGHVVAAPHDDAGPVPGHVREVPLVPGHRGAVGRPRRGSHA